MLHLAVVVIATAAPQTVRPQGPAAPGRAPASVPVQADWFSGGLALGAAPMRLTGDGRHACFSASEAENGPVDLNGDGDFLDEVLHTMDVRTGAVVNTRLVWVPSIHDPHAATSGRSLLADRLDEVEMGEDVNGDGFLSRDVAAAYVPSTGTRSTRSRWR
ncbi:MAG: hypothetical protein AAFP86_12110, partial [Planctomycetota bacterium]